MAKFALKSKAILMQKSGQSIREISNTLQIAKSTASIWCREIELTVTQKEKLYEKMIREGHYGRLKGAQANKEKKIATQKNA